MGYNTEFYGEFEITPALTAEHKAILESFYKERHEDIEFAGDQAIVYAGEEKFYNYVPWIQYWIQCLIQRFLAPWGYQLDGLVKWHGDKYGDIGQIVITNNQVSAPVKELPPLTMVDRVCGIVDRAMAGESDVERERR